MRVLLLKYQILEGYCNIMRYPMGEEILHLKMLRYLTLKNVKLSLRKGKIKH